MIDNPVTLSILLPVRNEVLNLRVMLRILNAALVVPHEILVIFDDEKDTSIAVVEEARLSFPGVRPVLNTMGKNVAYAIRAGVADAKGERILLFAADEVGPVLAIDDMLALMDEGAEFVSATRYAHGGRRLGGSIAGHALSRLANWLLIHASGTGLSDSTTGIKMFRRADFEALSRGAKSVGWAIAFEMAISAHLLGLKLGEVPIISIDRLFGGQSTFRLIPWVLGYFGYFATAMTKLSRNKRPAVSIRIPAGT